MTDVLQRICADKRREIEARRERLPLAELERRLAAAPARRPFAKALEQRAAEGQPALIAEIKKASPSRGLIRPDFDPPALAEAYQAGGAACLSVLTDGPYFQGEDRHLQAARTAVDLPVLRKDFTLDRYQVLEARLLGADCILLILAALDDQALLSLAGYARDLGLDVLLEVHDRDELERALAVPARLIGINNRNLKTLAVDLAVFESLAPGVPADRLLVAESGLYSHPDLVRMAAAGARAVLVGESLMRQADVARATRALLGRVEAAA
ncbi:MAG: indole-3-glycerol phosphate synthase TrpC [Geminicoccaceae bacterium]|nr:indole-3-glycerol phosphate synthase TrpC [Geminicoccaceae bacterium]